MTTCPPKKSVLGRKPNTNTYAHVDISRGVRSRWLDPGKAGATLIDPFCGPGKCKIRGTEEYIDGGVVVAWRKSVDSGTPFSSVYVGDIDPERLDACKKRLRALNAPVSPAMQPQPALADHRARDWV